MNRSPGSWSLTGLAGDRDRVGALPRPRAGMTRARATSPPRSLPSSTWSAAGTGRASPRTIPPSKFRGWTETHTWAWKFAKGKPVGLTLDDRGRKDPGGRQVDLRAGAQALPSRGQSSPGRPAGDSSSRARSTSRASTWCSITAQPAAKRASRPGTMRLSIWPNANFIRYTMAHDLKEAGSVQFTR